MSLTEAHKGYEYQDLATVYLILDEILSGNSTSTFQIDCKEVEDDIFDDFTINRIEKNNSKIWKFCIKKF